MGTYELNHGTGIPDKEPTEAEMEDGSGYNDSLPDGTIYGRGTADGNSLTEDISGWGIAYGQGDYADDEIIG